MATNINTVMTYPLDGSTTDFNIPFEYLARKFVRVTLIGVDRKGLILNNDYRFATKTTISTTRALGPADGYNMIEIRRFTSATDRLVDFTDGSILRAYDLNISQVQTLHVAEEARDLTADTIGVNNDGNLDARGRRIVNVADGVTDYDAISVGQVKRMNQNSWQARNEAQGFSNEAGQFRNQAEGFKSQAGTSATAAANSATNAAQSEVTAGQHSANASKSATSASNSAKSAATSETNAKNSELAAANSAAAARDSEKNTKDSASIVIQNISSYGSLPVGSVVATPINKAPAGFLKLDGSRFNKETYPRLFEFLGTDVLPDWRNRYLKGALNDDEVGVLKGWGLPARTGTAKAAGSHSHSGTTSTNGDHSHSGSTSTNGQHGHNVRYNNGAGTYTNRLVRGGSQAGFPGEDSVGDVIRPSGDHSHSFSTNTTGNHSHSFTTSTVGDHVHSLEIQAMGTGVMDVDHAKVHWWIKAYGTANAEDMAKVDAALQDIKAASNKVDSYEGRVRSLENSAVVVEFPRKTGTHEWFSIGTFTIGQLNEGLLIQGNGQAGNNFMGGTMGTQGISWYAKVWGGNGSPSNWINTQVNAFGGTTGDVSSDALPVSGICAAYVGDAADNRVEVFMRMGAYGSDAAIMVFGSPSTLASRTDVDINSKGMAVRKNTPANAMAGCVTFTKASQFWQETK